MFLFFKTVLYVPETLVRPTENSKKGKSSKKGKLKKNIENI